MAGSNAIASSSVIISANADKLGPGLKQAEKDVKHWSKGLGSGIGNELATELGKRGFAGGVLGGLIGGGIGGGLSELVANTLGELGVTDWINKGVKGFFSWASGADRAAESVARITEELRASGEELEKNFEKASRWRVTLDRGGQLSDIEGQLVKLSNRWNEIDESMKGALSQLHQIHLMEKSSLTGFTPTAGKKSELIGEINAKVTEQMKVTEKMNKLVLERESMEIALASAARKMIEAKKEEIHVWGLSGAAAEEALMRMRGHTEEEIKNVKELNVELKRLFEGNLGKTGVPFGFLMGAAGLGADMINRAPQPTQIPGLGFMLGGIGAAQQLIEKMSPKGLDNLAGAVEAGTAQGYSLSVRNRFGGIEGGGDQQRQANIKLDQIRVAIDDVARKLEEAMRGVGVL